MNLEVPPEGRTLRLDDHPRIAAALEYEEGSTTAYQVSVYYNIVGSPNSRGVVSDLDPAPTVLRLRLPWLVPSRAH